MECDRFSECVGDPVAIRHRDEGKAARERRGV